MASPGTDRRLVAPCSSADVPTLCEGMPPNGNSATTGTSLASGNGQCNHSSLECGDSSPLSPSSDGNGNSPESRRAAVSGHPKAAMNRRTPKETRSCAPPQARSTMHLVRPCPKEQSHENRVENRGTGLRRGAGRRIEPGPLGRRGRVDDLRGQRQLPRLHLGPDRGADPPGVCRHRQGPPRRDEAHRQSALVQPGPLQRRGNAGGSLLPRKVPRSQGRVGPAHQGRPALRQPVPVQHPLGLSEHRGDDPGVLSGTAAGTGTGHPLRLCPSHRGAVAPVGHADDLGRLRHQGPHGPVL